MLRERPEARTAREAAAGTGNNGSRNRWRMKIYFCGSIRGGRDDVNIYRRLVEKLQSYGTVLTEHVSSSELTDRGQRSKTTHVHRTHSNAVVLHKKKVISRKLFRKDLEISSGQQLVLLT